jgi:hypothetical protein
MKEYLSENWDGWPLHTAIALFIFWCHRTFDPATVLLIINTIFWPDREATQHHGYANIWTPHRIMDWGSPVLMGIGCYIGWFLK